MNSIELTENMEVSKWRVPAWVKLGFYVALGALTWQGAKITWDELGKVWTKVKYGYVSDIVASELDGKSFRLDPDMRNNKRIAISDMNPAQLTMALWTLDRELSDCQSTISTVNGLTTGIDVIYQKGLK